MSRKDNIDDIFRDKLNDFQKNPPADVWDKISTEIQSGKKKKLIPVFWNYAAGIIIIISIGAAWMFLNHSGDDLKELEMVAKNQEKLTTPEKRIDQKKPDAEEILQKETPKISKQETAAGIGRSESLIARRSEDVLPPEAPTKSETEVEMKNQEALVQPEVQTGYSTVFADITDLPHQIDPGKAGAESALMEEETVKKTYSWEDLGISIEENEPAMENRKFTLSAVVSPVYSYRDLGQVSSSLNEYFNQSESGKMNFSGGLNIGFTASKRLSIHSGLMYGRIGIGINDILTVAENWQPETGELINDRNASSAYLVNNSIGSIESGSNSRAKFEYSSSNEQSPSADMSTDLNYLNPEGFYAPADNYIPDDGTIDQYFQYLEVPLLFKYKLIDRKIDFNLLGGISTNFLVGNKVVYNQNGSSDIIGNTQNIRTVNYSGNLGLGLDYNISRHFHLLFEPQFKYYMNSINTDNLIGNRPYTLGLYSGFIYLF